MLALHSSVRAVSKQLSIICMASLFMAGPLATAQKETVLYTFCSQANCADGSGPYAGLIMDKQGNLYGTTVGGGAYGFGTAFRISTSGTEMVLYSFAGGTDGAYPYSGLVMDKENNVYGTTQQGGAYDEGTVFEINTAGTETVRPSGWMAIAEPTSQRCFSKPISNRMTTSLGSRWPASSATACHRPSLENWPGRW